MYSLFDINFFLLYRNYVFMWFSDTNEARHKIIFGKTKYLSCVFFFIAERNS